MDKKQQGIMESILIAQNFHALALNFCLRGERIKLNQIWYQNGLIHRDGDKPAIINSNGDKYWYKNGKMHRDEDNPAIIFTNGEKKWYKNGNLWKWRPSMV